MSKYTTEVRWICESKSQFSIEELPNKSVDEIIDAAWQRIFDFDFNFYNNDWNERIAKAVLKYYYTREIGLETVGLWKLKLNTRIMEITGKYRPLIEAVEHLTFQDFISNYKYTGNNLRTDNLADTRTNDLQSQRTDNLTRQDDAESKDKFSDTPQNGLTAVEQGNYLSSYRNVVTSDTVRDTGTQTTKDTGTQTDAHTGTQNTTYGETGYKGGPTVADFVSKIEYERFNIVGKIVYEFSDLFFLLW